QIKFVIPIEQTGIFGPIEDKIKVTPVCNRINSIKNGTLDGLQQFFLFLKIGPFRSKLLLHILLTIFYLGCYLLLFSFFLLFSIKHLLCSKISFQLFDFGI